MKCASADGIPGQDPELRRAPRPGTMEEEAHPIPPMADKEDNKPQPIRLAGAQAQARRRSCRQDLRCAADAAAWPLRAPLLASGHHRFARRHSEIALRRDGAHLLHGGDRPLPGAQLGKSGCIQGSRPLAGYAQSARQDASAGRGAGHYDARCNLSRGSALGLPLSVHPGLSHAVDRPEDHVRSAPRDLPPHAAHARGFLRCKPRWPFGHAPDLRRGRHQRHVYRRRPGHRQRRLHA